MEMGLCPSEIRFDPSTCFKTGFLAIHQGVLSQLQQQKKARKDSAEYFILCPGGLNTLFQMIMSCLQCYTLMRSMKPMSFTYAKDECQSVRGTLVTISDQVEQGEECSSSESLIDQLVCVSDSIVLQSIFKALVKKETIVLVCVCFRLHHDPFAKHEEHGHSMDRSENPTQRHGVD